MALVPFRSANCWLQNTNIVAPRFLLYLFHYLELAYYVAFGAHGPRTQVNPPGTALKVTATVGGLFIVAAAIVATIRSFGSSFIALRVQSINSSNRGIFFAASSWRNYSCALRSGFCLQPV